MSTGKWQVLWSPNQQDKFITYGNEICLYKVTRSQVIWQIIYFERKEYHTCCGSLCLTLASYFMQDFSGRNQDNFGEGIVGLTDHRLIWTQAVINSCLLHATSGLTTWESGLDHPFERVLSLNKLLSQEQYNLKVYTQTPWEASTNLAL